MLYTERSQRILRMRRYSRTHRSHGKCLPTKSTPHEPTSAAPPPPPGMASGYCLVLSWLACCVLRRNFRPRALCGSCPTISEGCPYTYIGTVFFWFWVWFFGSQDFCFGFFLLGFLGDLQLGDLSGFSSFLKGIFPYFQFRVSHCVLRRRFSSS